MATPKIFVSSTFYDLKHVRNDVSTFLRGLGYEPVMHDKGNITYSQNVPLEQSCYDEISTCDIVVCIIGNKFGTKSTGSDYSITMNELQEAIKKRKKIYIYILKDVFAENSTYIANKDTGTFIPAHVDNVKIHEFICDIKNTVRNHPIQAFELVTDITNNLKQQLAGLFQHLLSQEANVTESKTLFDLQSIADNIKNIVADFSKTQNEFFQKFDCTVFARLTPLRMLHQILGIEKVIFYAKDEEAIIEMFHLLGFSIVDEDIPFISLIFSKQIDGMNITISLGADLFDESNKLKDIRDIKLLEKYITKKVEVVDDDDLPF